MDMKSEEAEASMQQEGQVHMPPVLEEKKKRVMVAIDESDESSYALKWALDNLFFYGSSTSHVVDEHQKDEEAGVLILVHVQQPFQHYIFPVGPGAVYATTPVIDSVKKSQAQNSALVVSKAMQLCKGRPIKAESIVCDGDPKDMICQIAEQTHPDVVVVGSRGLGQLKRAFLGSVSDYCAHHVKCPILIVKPVKPPK